MARTRNHGVRIPDDLLTLAAHVLDIPDGASSAVVIRTALARIAGVDVSDYTPVKTGRPRGARTHRQTEDGEQAA